MPQASDSQTTAQTDTVLVTAPGVGKQIVVTNEYVSSLLANTVSVASGLLVGIPEVTTVDRGTSTGGTFTLTYDTETTAAIAFGALASAVEAAVELLANVTAATVTGTGTVGDPWIITLDTPAQSFAVSGTGSLTGGDATLTVTETTDGEAVGAARRISYLSAATSETSDAAKNHLFTCGDNAALTYTSTAATSLFVSCQYSIRSTSDLSS